MPDRRSGVPGAAGTPRCSPTDLCRAAADGATSNENKVHAFNVPGRLPTATATQTAQKGVVGIKVVERTAR
eukprot:3119689-Lingulodinium_polyedra.AAC.1